MKKHSLLLRIILLAILSGLITNISALTNDEIKFLTDKEQFHILQKYPEAILAKVATGTPEDIKAVLFYAQRSDLPGLALKCHKKLALDTKSLEDALQWLLLMKASEVDSLELTQQISQIQTVFTNTLDRQIFLLYAGEADESSLQPELDNADTYNSVVEAWAKELIDEISTTRDDSLALAQIDNFYASYPKSTYIPIAYYYKLYHLSTRKDWQSMLFTIPQIKPDNPVQAYMAAMYLMSPTLRKNLPPEANILQLADSLITQAYSAKPQILLYDNYSAPDWHARVELLRLKIEYFKLLQLNELYGDEENLSSVSILPAITWKKHLKTLNNLSFTSNDRGEQAEQQFWLAKYMLLSGKKSHKLQAAKYLVSCLRLGAPRKRYDDDAQRLLTAIAKDLGIKQPLISWMRSLSKYKGIVFEDISSQNGLDGLGYSRVALSDYNNDGFTDILFTGNHLLKNDGKLGFYDVSDSTALSNVPASGGLFADFNKDGRLDLMTYNHNDDGNGDRLLKNQDNQRFVNVNERAGDIDDKFPTEAAAWIDTKLSGFPSLYLANYEKWQQQSGYPDFYWQNEGGYFSDKSLSYGFRSPLYTTKPGQAGRGVSPADFDNDGRQEIFVSNYRLNRNFCWKQVDTLFVDVAALYDLAGTHKQGYFGHTIGADWGDYDNDGDLDIFIANLAHPRYLDISDISMLLRNDGLTQRVVEADTVYYWQFTNVTTPAGIKYDELHSDPLFFDADNDGWLDLFITSVYVGERSYLYRNKGDGTFEDVTWLSGARVYNGWGNAAGDLDRDGLQDLVVGSGSGARILHNRTLTKNRSVTVKPVWKNEIIHLESDPTLFCSLPNSPAFGTRVVLTLKSPKGKTYRIIRELCSAKGTGSQNAPELHFGIGNSKVLEIKRFTP